MTEYKASSENEATHFSYVEVELKDGSRNRVTFDRDVATIMDRALAGAHLTELEQRKLTCVGIKLYDIHGGTKVRANGKRGAAMRVAKW